MVIMTENSDRISKTGIILLGLGPGDPSALTRRAWDWLAGIDKLYLRTAHHPTVASLPTHLTLVSFDELYERHDDFEDVYEAIIEEILTLGKTTVVTYAVPGHPFVAEATCPEIAKRAAAAGISVEVIDGLSFLEPTFLALKIDPFPDLVLADAIQVSQRQTPGFPPSTPALIAQIYDRDVAAEVKLTLMAAYPDEHPVHLVHAAGTDDEVVEDLPLYAIDHSPHLGLLSSLYIPPLSRGASFEAFQEVIARLRAPDGCPWDREQTHLSLRPFLLEEAYETLDALDREDMDDLAEELGDLLLQIVLHAQIATEEGDFNIHHVLEGIGSKLIRRHPHVFSEVEVAGVDGVIRNWEQIKAEERLGHSDDTHNGLLNGVPAALPALSQAAQIIERVRRVGFVHLSMLGDPQVIGEMLAEVEDAEGDEQNQVLGELLLGVTGLAYKADIDAESALREALTRFRTRFGTMEASALASGRALMDLSAEDLVRLWQAAGDSGNNEVDG
jgi:tetrapyrrole methylase family protein / MazG family protein